MICHDVGSILRSPIFGASSVARRLKYRGSDWRLDVVKENGRTWSKH